MADTATGRAAAPTLSTTQSDLTAHPDFDRINGSLEGVRLAWDMVHRVRQVLPEDSRAATPVALDAHRKLLARVESAPSASWGAGLLAGWVGVFGSVAYLNAVRTVQHYPWEPEEEPTRNRRDEGALAFAAVLRAIHPQVTAAAPEAARSPRQIGALILEAMHGGPEYAAGFAEALGCWLAGDLEGVPCNLETFDPLAEIQNFADKGVGHD